MELAALLRDDAERRDLTLSDHIGNLIAATYGQPPIAEKTGIAQMKLTA